MTSGLSWFLVMAGSFAFSLVVSAMQPIAEAEAERTEALQSLHPVCRVYYDERERCVSAKLSPAEARNDLGRELAGLVMLSYGVDAAKACLRQIDSLRIEQTFGCAWRIASNDVTEYLQAAGACDSLSPRAKRSTACHDLPAWRRELKRKYESNPAVLRLLDVYRD